MGLKEIQVPFDSHRNLRGMVVHGSGFRRDDMEKWFDYQKGGKVGIMENTNILLEG